MAQPPPLQGIEATWTKAFAAPKAYTHWRTPAQATNYRRRLLQALSSTSSSRPPRVSPPRAIKDAADAALAVSAKGQTRWSRAILLSQRRRLRSLVKIRKPSSLPRRASKPGPRSEMEGRLRALAQLVPGGRGLSPATLLEEAADYVPALEMQVKALRSLVDALSSSSSSTSAAASAGMEN